MKTIATVMQVTRSLLILTPADYDKTEGGFSSKSKKSSVPTNFRVPQIFELNDSLKDHPYEKTEELAAFVKRCASSVEMQLGDVFVCIEDEDVLITKEYKHAPAKEKLLPTFAHVEAENVLHNDVQKYTILNFEYGQQYGKANKGTDVSASLFAMDTAMLTDLRANFEKEGIHIVKVVPPIAGLLYSAKADLNSATRSIAVISMDFAATRLVVLHNGAPVFQQAFSSVLEDVAELFSLEFGISKLGAIDLIRQEGLGACNKCNNPDTRKQTMGMLDNAAGEILRNLRMVISTMRLDIDQIVLCDALAKLPNIAQYCRSVGLTAPMENVINLFSGGSLPPVAEPSAQDKGFDATSFITFNGILSMPLPEANLILGETSAMAALAGSKGSSLGKAITAGVAVVALLWMVGVGGWWLALEMQKGNDTNQLASKEYDPAKQLINEEQTYRTRLDTVERDKETMPHTVEKSSKIVSKFYTQVAHKVQNTGGISFVFSSEACKITTSVNVKDFTSFINLKNDIVADKYFNVDEAYSITNNNDNGVAYSQANITLDVTNEQYTDEESSDGTATAAAATGGTTTTETSSASSQASAS